MKKLKRQICISRSIFESHNIREKISINRKKSLENKFWKNKILAQKIIKETKFLEEIYKIYLYSKNEINNIKDLLKLALNEKNLDVVKDCLKSSNLLLSEIKKTEVKCFLSGENDVLDTYLEIHAGAGGTESQDWAAMLRRMYLRWADKNRFKSEIISEHKGDEAGLKSSTIKICGSYVYGWLKSESGVHRLVRISPFDSGARRHTSFASVWVYPVVDDSINVEIIEKDLRIDTYRSSGAGGQHVNTTDSAVRITHIPTNIVVQCQNERSQHKNKETCLNMLKARLYEHELQKQNNEQKDLESNKADIGWGHQIRTYVLQPYRLVKDLRNNYENTNPDKVLDGDINDFLENSLFRLKS